MTRRHFATDSIPNTRFERTGPELKLRSLFYLGKMTNEEIMARFEVLEKEIAALKKRKPPADSPFLKRQEAIRLLKTRSLLERCERAGWIKATTRQARLVLYLRVDVMATVYRISQGEYP